MREDPKDPSQYISRIFGIEEFDRHHTHNNEQSHALITSERKRGTTKYLNKNKQEIVNETYRQIC